jgi:integrase
MGVTVRQKKKGRGNPWYVFVHHNGRIQSKKVGDKKIADSIAAKIKKKLVAGELNLEQRNTCPKFGDYAKHYIDNYAKHATKQNTWKNYETMIKLHLNPVWQNKRLNQIKRADVKKLILQKQQDSFAASTVENIKALVSGIFTHAYEEELLSANPALKLGRFIQKQDSRKHIKSLAKEQVTTFLSVARQETPDHYALLLFVFRTGVRMGELIGLAWEDIDFAGNMIEVRRSYSHGHFSSPKSHKSRFIDMSNQLRQTLLAHRSSQVAKFGGTLPRLELSDKFKPDNVIRLVFPNKCGKPLCGDNFRKRVFKPLLETVDIPAIRFHDIRHTFASLLLQQGESLHYVKEQMGHASIQTTVDVYGHIVPGSNRNAVNKLDDKITPDIKLVSTAG